VTPSGKLLKAVEKEINRNYPDFSRAVHPGSVAKQRWLVQVSTLAEASR